nr:hypothetical protein [Dyadobacter frigoris]
MIPDLERSFDYNLQNVISHICFFFNLVTKHITDFQVKTFAESIAGACVRSVLVKEVIIDLIFSLGI